MYGSGLLNIGSFTRIFFDTYPRSSNSLLFPLAYRLQNASEPALG